MRLIDADAVIDVCNSSFWPETVKRRVNELPTIDAVPVVHGEWIEYGEPNSQGEYELWYWTCSKCSAVGLGTFNYCPECGARMDGE